jgi:hypothetical protein
MYPKQERALFCKERYGCVEASTKAGKTVACIVWLSEQGFQYPLNSNHVNLWWVAPTYQVSMIAYRRFQRAIPRQYFTPHAAEVRIELWNGVSIWFKSAENPDNLYGEDVFAAVIDEASRVKEESWYAVRSTITATRAPIRLIGNVKGRKNWFYKMCRTAEAGDPAMHYEKITWHDAVAAGVLAEDEIRDARAQLPEQVFQELYEAEASDDGGNPFGIDAIRACIKPMSIGTPVAWGWDLAKSVDWTVGIGLDKFGATVRFNRFQNPWLETTRRIKEESGTTKALIDSTGVGDPILETLQRTGHGRFEGFKYSSASKQQLMEGLAVAIQHKQITFPEGAIVQELEMFEYEYTRTGVVYTAPRGVHDDCVNSLALAVKQWQTVRRYMSDESSRKPVFAPPIQ